MPVPLALAGRVPVLVTLEGGPILPGDDLTGSSKPGYAMKATKKGAVFGRALTAFAGPGDGMVTAFIGEAERTTESEPAFGEVIRQLQERLQYLEAQLKVGPLSVKAAPPIQAKPSAAAKVQKQMAGKK